MTRNQNQQQTTLSAFWLHPEDLAKAHFSWRLWLFLFTRKQITDMAAGKGQRSTTEEKWKGWCQWHWTWGSYGFGRKQHDDGLIHFNLAVPILWLTGWWLQTEGSIFWSEPDARYSSSSSLSEGIHQSHPSKQISLAIPMTNGAWMNACGHTPSG